MTRSIVLGAFVTAGIVSGAAVVQGQSAPQAAVPVEAAAPAPGQAANDAKDANATGQPASGEAAAGQAGQTPAPEPQGFTYRAEGRRDPFVTLLKRGSETSSTTAAGRAAGLAGLTTGEVTLRGILASEGAYVAMLLGSDDKTYIVRTGDRLADGTIQAISADAMVILQRTKDPLATQREREVRKLLRQIEGTH
jgi:Tfp pilus assembly protein PilP